MAGTFDSISKDLSIRIAGSAGQGLQSIGQTLCKILKSLGLDLYGNANYMSRIRGGNNFIQIRLAGHPVSALRSRDTVIIAMDGPSMGLHKPFLEKDGLFLGDRKRYGNIDWEEGFLDVPFHEIGARAGGGPLYAAVAALGSLAALFQISQGEAESALRGMYARKPAETLHKNIMTFNEGYAYFNEHFSQRLHLPVKSLPDASLLLNGNEAIALGAANAGCRFYTAYPMTPATSLLTCMARFSQSAPILVEQAEDEIAAVNMAIGASFAGVRSMTGTSGGGFDLMAEGVSLAAMTETPLVVVVGQRPGPATGFPTRTEQSDLDMVLHAGHGEFARAVFTPGSIGEAFRLTIKAFDVSEKYQIPAFILTDQFLADGMRTLPRETFRADPVSSGLIPRQEQEGLREYQRYAFTPSGISPRAVPGWSKAVIYADSDEHTEMGHITEDGQLRIRMVDKRLKQKTEFLTADAIKPDIVGCLQAEIILIGFGSTKGPLEEVRIGSNGRIGTIHFSQVWPFPGSHLRFLSSTSARVFTVENNAGAQLGHLIRRQTGFKPAGSFLKYDGRPFYTDELAGRIEREDFESWT